MCLSLTVILPDEKQKDADVIAKNASTDKIKASKEKRWFGRLSRFLFIASEVDSCACNLLTDNADWNDETWDIIPSYLPHIASILTNIHQQIPEGFLFEALWAGDKPTAKKELSIKELSRIIKDNKIETKTTYKVTPAD